MRGSKIRVSKIRVSKIEIYAKFLHTRPGPSCSSLSRLISPRAYLWYTPWNPPSHRGGRFRCTASGASHSQGAVRSRPPSHTAHQSDQ